MDIELKSFIRRGSEENRIINLLFNLNSNELIIETWEHKKYKLRIKRIE